MSVKRMILAAGAAGALAGAVLVAFLWNSPYRPSPQSSFAPSDATSTGAGPSNTEANPVGAPSVAAAHPVSRASESAGDRDSRWSAFREKFGSELRGEFHEGRLVSLQGALGTGAKAGADFDSSDPRKVSARAREVLAALSELLGLNPELPLDGPRAIPGPASAQAVFRETLEGDPLAPLGAITLDFGPQGELIGVDSSYLPAVQASNSVRLAEPQARERALAAVHDSVESGMRVEGGSRVAWVTEPAPEGRPAVARRAYEYSVKGRQVLVDAGDGGIIATRDRRHF